jgi:DNA-binding NtrC family response regulator
MQHIEGGPVVRVWEAKSREPSGARVYLDGDLLLDRDRFGADDGTLSRAANAPRLRALGGALLQLDVPERSAHRALVIPGFRFDALQYGIAPAAERWKIAPSELARPGRLAFADRAAVCLARPIAWDRPGPSHHLIFLPPVLAVERGTSASFPSPALIVIGTGAVDVTADETLSPALIPGAEHADDPSPLHLNDLLRSFDDPDLLAALPAPPLARRYVLPHGADLHGETTLARAAARVLEELGVPYAFLPALEDGVRPRLAFAFKRNTGVRLLVSSGHPARFLDELQATIERLGAQPHSGTSTGSTSTGRHSTGSYRMPDTPAPHAHRSSRPPPNAGDPIAQFGEIVTASPRMAVVLRELDHVADSDLGVLFLGESGTGKEHLARALHRASSRVRGPFIAVNCSALGDQLIDSELFGHKRGAFTGAHGDRTGAFTSAHGGTLLLDEIGDAPLRVQLALLRVLQERCVRPVGSDREHPVDVRVLAATSSDLRASMHAGRFREDLYFRLAELVCELPPLRDRAEDIPALARALLAKHRASATLSPQALELLVAHPFPGNIRELENALKRAVALSRGAATLEAHHFAHLTDFVAGTWGASAGTRASTDPAFVFPEAVKSLADALWEDPSRGSFSEDEGASHGSRGSRYEHRARHRAALLELATRHPLDAWPRALVLQWGRLFGAKWASTENGRNVRELARELGMDARSAESERRVLRMVSGVAVGRVGRR